MSVRPSIKTNNNTTKRREMQTTMSANLVGKTRSRQRTKLSKTQAPNISNNDNKPNISPFQLNTNEQNQNEKQSFQLKAIKNINHEYIQLFHQLFKNNPNLKDPTNAQSINKLNREERYQLQCMKMLNKATINIDRINYQRKVAQDWNQISDYLVDHPQMESKNKQPFKIAIQLMKKYKTIEEQLQCVQYQHKQLTKKSQLQMWQIYNKPETTLTIKQKQYKQTQKKLNKILNDQQYYMAKLEKQQEALEALQQRINKIQQTKLTLQMKVISEKAKKDRLVRKAKEKRQKSLTPHHNNKEQQKVVRSKSSIRVNIFRD